MVINFSIKTETELNDLLRNGSLNTMQRKIVASLLNSKFGLLNAIVYVKTDLHPHYVKQIDPVTGELGLNLLYGYKAEKQKSKRGYYWIDYHGKRRKSYHRGGKPRLNILPEDLDRVNGKTVKNPTDISEYKTKFENT